MDEPVKKINKSQRRALDFIANFIENKGYPPSLSEIGDALGFTKATAQYYVQSLEKSGYLRKGKHKTRALVLPKESVAEVPKLGYIAAGDPIEPVESHEIVAVPTSLTKKPGQYFALTVKGNSMVEDGIYDGDTIVARHQFDAENGSTVIAIMEDGGVTLKTLKKPLRNSPYLQPQNDSYGKITGYFSIQGVVAGIVRQA